MSNERQYMDLCDLPGLGPQSAKKLFSIGITSVDAFNKQDPFDIYAKLKAGDASVSLNFLYAIIGAQELKSWKDIANTRRTEILLRLDDMGIAP